MEVKPGYKRTEVGVIPEEWEVCSVGQMGEVLTGKALAVNAPGQQRPYLRTKNVFDGRIDIDDVLTMPMTEAQFEVFRIEPGDVLLNEGQSLELVGRCALYSGEYPAPCAMQNQLLRFRARHGVSGEFASHLFRYAQQTGTFAKIALQTTSIAHLGGKRFEQLRLAWPRAGAEQRAIATALSDVDALLTQLDRLIAKKRDIKQAAMQQLLTGKTRLPGFDGEWQGIRLREIATFRTGPFGSALHKSDYTFDGVPVINPMHIIDGRLVPTESMSVTESAAQGLSEFRLRENDLVIGRRGEMGRCAVVKYENDGWLCGTGSMIVRAVCSVDPSYLQRVLASPSIVSAIEESSVGSTMINLNQQVLGAIAVQLPALEEQTAIATLLSDLDAELTALEARRDKTRALKQGMMQELLTGRTRLA